MGTMQAQPGTPAALEQALRAQNPMENTSIEQALKYNAWAHPLGVGFDSMVVQQTSGTTSGDDEYTFPQVQAMGINQTSPLYVFGYAGTKEYNVALELVMIAGLDGENSYIKIFAVRNPGSSVEDALAALTQVESVSALIKGSLNASKKQAGLF